MCKEIIDFSKTIVITNRALVRGDFPAQMESVSALRPESVILREKDLNPEAYSSLYRAVKEITDRYSVPLFWHGFSGENIEAGKKEGAKNIHLSIPMLRYALEKDLLRSFSMRSVSCHSQGDVREACMAGADRIILGTIFETECKKGLAGKGLSFVREITDNCPLPVYAIGGITPERLLEIQENGAKGGCMMSWFMRYSGGGELCGSEILQ